MNAYKLNVDFEISSNWFRIVFPRKMQMETVEKTVDKILALIKENPLITQQELMKKTGLTRRCVEWNLKELKKEGIIKRIGPDKGGHWEVSK